MKRIRHVSVEMIRRELSLSVTRPVVKNSEERPVASAEDKNDRSSNPLRTPPCSECTSPLFLLQTGGGEDVDIVKRTLQALGIHFQQSSAKELLVCVASFELQSKNSAIPAVTELTRLLETHNDPP